MPRPKKLLVVDDSRSTRAALQKLLQERGYEVDICANGDEALATLDEVAYDLMLLDVIMPGIDGLEVLRRVRERFSKLSLPVLMATARTDSSDVVRALELGANDYVTKPLDLAVACARIESQLSVREISQKEQQTALMPDGSVPLGTVLDGRYELLEILGAGGFAVVYKATQVSTGQTVAVKLLRAHRAATPGTADIDLARFRREMNLIGDLQHPHIVRLVDSGWLRVGTSRSIPASQRILPSSPPGSSSTIATVALKPSSASMPEADETVSTTRRSEPTSAPDSLETRIPFIVMEYLEGESLYQHLMRRGALSVSETVDLALPVISAVWAAHVEGVIHRDLKPGNIFLSRGRQGALWPTVLDFGVAKLAAEDDHQLTVTASMVGTPGYWSPEQARGVQDVDARSDQYTLGTILYQCVTGTRPFEGKGIQLVHRIARGSFPPPHKLAPDLPPPFEKIVLKAMASEPNDRYPTLRSLARALLPWASDRGRGQWQPIFEKGGTNPPPR